MNSLCKIIITGAALGVAQYAGKSLNKEIIKPLDTVDGDSLLSHIKTASIGAAGFAVSLELRHLSKHLPDVILNNSFAENYGVIGATLLLGGAATYLHHKIDPECKGYKLIIPALITAAACYLGFTKTGIGFSTI